MTFPPHETSKTAILYLNGWTRLRGAGQSASNLISGRVRPKNPSSKRTITLGILPNPDKHQYLNEHPTPATRGRDWISGKRSL
jgi:hypothetical protein